MVSVRRAMMNHGIPSAWTGRLSDEFGLKSVEDIKNMELFDIKRAPKEFWQKIMDMRNLYKEDDATMWSVTEEWE
jgi:hypothetical protein